MKSVNFVTTNANKFREAERILGFRLRQARIGLPEIQSLKAREVAGFKAKEAYSKLRKPVIVEDTALYLKDWNGFPGALISWAVKTIGIERLCELVGRERAATAEACVAYYDGLRLRVFCSEISGKISEKPRGRKRFDWDRIFIPSGEKRTFAEMSMEEKNLISHRMKAFVKLREYLSHRE